MADNGFDVHISGDRVLALFDDLAIIKTGQMNLSRELGEVKNTVQAIPCSERLKIMNSMAADISELKRQRALAVQIVSKAFLLVYGLVITGLSAGVTLAIQKFSGKIAGAVTKMWDKIV